MTNPNPIGIFDSGVGGISVMKEIKRLLPHENLIYFADSAYCPYGIKDPDEIRLRMIKITRFLIEHNAKLIVAACNTASIAGIDFMRQKFNIPIIGMEPAVKPAVSITQNGKVGVMATGVTLGGKKFNSLLERFACDVEVQNVACPGLVEQVEQGLIDALETEQMLRGYLEPLKASGVDTVVLGCTHYPFLRPLVESILGPGVRVIDTGRAVANRVAQVLTEQNLANQNSAANVAKTGRVIFFTSGEPGMVGQVIVNLWGSNSLQVKPITL